MMRKHHVRFGGGRLEKEPKGNLVSRLPDSIDSLSARIEVSFGPGFLDEANMY